MSRSTRKIVRFYTSPPHLSASHAACASRLRRSPRIMAAAMHDAQLPKPQYQHSPMRNSNSRNASIVLCATPPAATTASSNAQLHQPQRQHRPMHNSTSRNASIIQCTTPSAATTASSYAQLHQPQRQHHPIPNPTSRNITRHSPPAARKKALMQTIACISARTLPSP